MSPGSSCAARRHRCVALAGSPARRRVVAATRWALQRIAPFVSISGSEAQDVAGNWENPSWVAGPLAAGAPLLGVRGTSAPGRAWVNIDTGRPTCAALVSARASRGGRVSLRYRVSDRLPTCGKASVRIRVYRGKKLMKTLKPGTVKVNAETLLRLACHAPQRDVLLGGQRQGHRRHHPGGVRWANVDGAIVVRDSGAGPGRTHPGWRRDADTSRTPRLVVASDAEEDRLQQRRLGGAWC